MNLRTRHLIFNDKAGATRKFSHIVSAEKPMKIRKLDNKLRASIKTNFTFVAIAVALLGIGWVLYFFDWSRFFAFLATGLGLYSLWLALNQWMDQIEIHSESLEVRSGWKSETVAKGRIASITRAKGVGVILNLKEGGQISIPDLGNATSVCNILRAWLKRTE